jgi:hypothetical protein
MKHKPLLILTLPLICQAALGVDYTVDFSRVSDLEAIRPLVEGCANYDALELYRPRLETSTNLEEMRSTLSGIGFGMFIDCPAGVSGSGIAPVAGQQASRAPGYSVDFTRVEDFESLRPLVTGCRDFGALEHFRERLEASGNLNTMRSSLREVGFGMFEDCPAGVSGAGIAPVE